jgi:hypothetical protein
MYKNVNIIQIVLLQLSSFFLVSFLFRFILSKPRANKPTLNIYFITVLSFAIEPAFSIFKQIYKFKQATRSVSHFVLHCVFLSNNCFVLNNFAFLSFDPFGCARLCVCVIQELERNTKALG